MGKIKDISGQRFGKLTVTSEFERRKKATYWKCKCECGNEKFIQVSHLIGGYSRSCGCVKGFGYVKKVRV